MNTAATAPAPAAGLGRTFGLAWLIAFTGAVTPGPMLALVIGQVLAQGFAAVLLILLGHALLELLMVGGFAFGLAAPLRRPRVRGALAVLGGLALAWMGLAILRDARHASLAASAARALSWPLLVAAGAGVSLSNPYFTGWWATVGTGQMATFGLRRWRDYAAFWVGHECGDVVWYVAVGALLALGRGLLSDAAYQSLLMVCGFAIVVVAAVFLILGVRCLRPAGSDLTAAVVVEGAPDGLG